MLASSALCALSAAPTHAQQADLEALVRRQAEQIARLEARLNALEATTKPAASSQAQVAPPAVPALAAPAPTPVTSELATRLAKVEQVQAKQSRIDWARGGPEFSSADGSFTFHPRLRLFLDASTTSGSKLDSRNLTGTEGRDFMLGFDGRLGGPLSYLVEVAFTDNKTSVKNVFVAWTQPVGGDNLELSVGNRVTERTMEGSTAINDIHFLERNAVAAATQPQAGYYGMGVRARYLGRGWHIGLEASGNDINELGAANDTALVSTRVHWTPLSTPRGLIHLGAWGYLEDISSGTTSASRNIYIGGHFADALQIRSGTVSGPSSSAAYGVELAESLGPTWAIAEYGHREINAASTHPQIDAYALSAGWFLTGEHIAYAARTGIWGRQTVSKAFNAGGPGAVELVGRYEHAALFENVGLAGVGGAGSAVTVGLNWYLTPNVKLAGSYSAWRTDNASGSIIGPDDGQTLAASMRLTY